MSAGIQAPGQYSATDVQPLSHSHLSFLLSDSQQHSFLAPLSLLLLFIAAEVVALFSIMIGLSFCGVPRASASLNWPLSHAALVLCRRLLDQAKASPYPQSYYKCIYKDRNV